MAGAHRNASAEPHRVVAVFVLLTIGLCLKPGGVPVCAHDRGAADSRYSAAADPEPAGRPADGPAAPDVADGDRSRGDDPEGIFDLDIDQLAKVDVVAPSLDVEVSTVARTESTVGHSPTAVFVITNEMIRRSGAESIPEVLRMAPGIQVARIDANKWAISARGFNGRYANKLLVQIDGRSVYTPLYAGVYWDVQDVLLEDVERIEVIRGPGASVWGANAVNGIINVITKKTRDTQGTYVQGGAGTEQQGFTSARVGGRLSDSAHYRVYGKWFERDESFDPDGNARDDWRMGRGGFRLDWEPNACDTVTLQGDYYDGYSGRQALVPDLSSPRYVAPLPEDDHVSGGNVLLRWGRKLSEDSDWQLQCYYDRTERHATGYGFSEDRDTLDLDFQHRFPLGCRHSLIWGFGYRFTEDSLVDEPFYVEFEPNDRAADLFSYFVQDEITLWQDLLYLTVGSKFEHNDYTQFEFQPSVRLLWTPTPRHSIWGAISRAVHTPSRAEDDVRVTMWPNISGPLPVFPVAEGNRALESEDLLAFEAGIRAQPTDAFFWDVAVFYQKYDDVRAFVLDSYEFMGSYVLYPAHFGNPTEGEAYGFELAATCQVAPCWTLRTAYSLLRVEIDPQPGTMRIDETDGGQSPQNQLHLWSSWDLGRGLELDVIGRYVDNLPKLNTPSYFVMDVRLGWRPNRNLEMAVVGRHLLDRAHPEYGHDLLLGDLRTEVEREVFGSVTWRY